MNRTLEEFYSIKSSKLISKKIDELFTEDADEITSKVEKVLNKKESFFNIKKDNRNKENQRTLLVSYFPLPDEEAGNIVIDISDRIKAENALSESEERFRTIYEFSPLGISILDTKGNYRRTNEAFQKIVGYAENELQKLNFKDITFPDDKKTSNIVFNSLVEQKFEKFQIEKRYVKKDGSTVWVNSIISLIKEQNGSRVRIVNMIEDITGRKQAELELIEKEKYYRALFENSSDSENYHK